MDGSRGRGAFRRQGRARALSVFHYLALPRRLDGVERQPGVSGHVGAGSRRHAQGRSSRAMNATRRLAAILAVDVVGYSRLMGEDEAGTASVGATCGNCGCQYRHFRSAFCQGLTSVATTILM